MVQQIMNHQGLRALVPFGGKDGIGGGVSVNSYVFCFGHGVAIFFWGGSHSDARLHFCPLPVVIGNGESSGINFRLRPKKEG